MIFEELKEIQRKHGYLPAQERVSDQACLDCHDGPQHNPRETKGKYQIEELLRRRSAATR